MIGMVLRSLKLVRLGFLVVVLVASVFLLSAVSAAPQDSYKLSSDGPLPIGGDVHDFEVSPDGVYTVYRAGQDVVELAELYVVPTSGGSASVKLSALPEQGRRINEYGISPDSVYVVYNGDQDSRGVYELYSVRLDGSTQPVKLSGEMVEGGSLVDFGGSFRISPDGSRVVYRADQETDGVMELFSAPVDGSGAAVKLNGTLAAGGGTLSYEISADSQYVVYRADQDVDGVDELYRVPLDGSGGPEKLNDPLVAGGNVSDFTFSPDSQWVLYLADQDTDDVIELYRVPLDGSAGAMKLNGTLVAGGDVGFGGNFFVSPDSQRVIYLADQDTNDVFELYGVAISGGAVVKLNPPLVAGGEVSWVWSPQISADSSRVVYLADQDTNDLEELFSVPIAGGTAVKLNGTLAGGSLFDFAIAADSSRVVYRARQDSATRNELYSVPLAGGTVTKLNGSLSNG